LIALNASTGALLWTYSNDYSSNAPAAVANGIVFITTYGSTEALDISTQTLLWSYPAGFEMAMANGVVFAGDGQNTVYALDATSGVKLWSSNGGGGAPAIANGVVYTVSNYEPVYALDASSGATLWSYTASPYVSAPVVVNGGLYVTSIENIYAFGLK
jgi:outer membrane protein assembly factor BamB